MPVIATNTTADTSIRYLNLNAMKQSQTLSHIASGKRIVSAADDAAGLALATRLKSDVTTLGQAGVNASHGVSILQIADGGLAKISDILQRMKTLVAQSLSGAVDDSKRGYIDTEFQQLLKEIDSIADSTRFSGKTLLGAKSTWASGGTGGKGGTAGGISFLLGTDVESDMLTVTVAKADATTLGVKGDVKTQTAAKTVGKLLDTAVDKISQQRADLGSYISRFKFRAENLSQSANNVSAAKSKIEDADIAREQANFSSQKVLTNAAVNALAQANQIPQSLMVLFR